MKNSKIISKFPSGRITPPASKSVSHRALICAALAGGDEAVARVSNIGVSDDITATRRALEVLLSGDSTKTIDCGESGSTLRFLIPIAAVLGGEWRFVGQGRLLDRPLDVYDGVFAQSGALLERDGDSILVRGPLKAGKYEIVGNVSSQFISGLMFALPLLDGDSEIVLTTELESVDYVNLTIDVMSAFGVDVYEIAGQARNDATQLSNDATQFSNDAAQVVGYQIPGHQTYIPVDFVVEADWSQAAFFLVAGALGLDVEVSGFSMDSLQGDMRILDVLESAGATIFETVDESDASKYDIFADDFSLSTLSASPSEDGLNAITLDVSDIPDLVPPIAALLCYADGTSYINNAGRLRIKESDRLEALVAELGNIGADIRAEDDSLVIVGKKKLSGGSADAHGDLRIAMAVAVAAIGCENAVKLTGWESVGKSYPGFWDDFEKE
jgi:3-phosphoshikimate 1-carboxyvinyltransferase